MKTEHALVFRKCVIEQLRRVLREELKTYDLRGQVQQKLDSGEWKLARADAGMQILSTLDRSVVLELDGPSPLSYERGVSPETSQDERVDWIVQKILSNWDLIDLYTPSVS